MTIVCTLLDETNVRLAFLYLAQASAQQHVFHFLHITVIGGVSAIVIVIYVIGGVSDFLYAEPHGDGLLVAGLFFTDYPPSWEKIPPVEDLGLCDPLGEPGWLSW